MVDCPMDARMNDLWGGGLTRVTCTGLLRPDSQEFPIFLDELRVLDALALCHVCALLSKLVLAARAISGFVNKKRKIVSFFPLAIVLDLLAHMVTSLHLIVNLSLYSSFGNVCLNRK